MKETGQAKSPFASFEELAKKLLRVDKKAISKQEDERKSAKERKEAS